MRVHYVCITRVYWSGTLNPTETPALIKMLMVSGLNLHLKKNLNNAIQERGTAKTSRRHGEPISL